ncbi:ribonuclease HII [Granulosicoccaceae sp. 1_MG-2023]|nr:ribonuclease HII [Granulosicoccaceae sp. 1_MG-2023]
MQHDLYIAGVDEVGRGPLVGPVVAAAVILGPDHGISHLADSKKLSEKRRQALDLEIREKALCWAIAEASAREIDELNILHASMLAMQRAIEALTVRPSRVLVDGNRMPKCVYAGEPVVKGDATVAEISAASIIAKVHRDAGMIELDRAHPGYGFAAHKGYPTKAHREALVRLGPLDEHRRSFGPVARVLAGNAS